jgi:hypothetical protein
VERGLILNEAETGTYMNELVIRSHWWNLFYKEVKSMRLYNCGLKSPISNPVKERYLLAHLLAERFVFLWGRGVIGIF